MSRAGSSPGLEGTAALAPSRDRPLTVGQLLAAARRALDTTIRSTWVVGEVDSLNLHRASGHYYFCLKDARAQIGAVMWRADAQALRFKLDNGQSLICRGHFDVYDRQGRFQFIVKHAEPAGLGADALAREQLKQRLQAEGLFDPRRKRELPRLPRAIGLCTSKSGAAVRDVIRAVQRRFPVPILIADCRVQGPTAPASIARAIAMLGRTDVDVVIVGRGGGGATELAAFDSEAVIRAVAACPVPTISAVGHEIDLSLCDLVADHRAATPTMAGEMAVPVWSDLYEQLTVIERRMARELEHTLRGARHEVAAVLGRGERRVASAIGERRQALADLGRRLAAAHPRARLARDHQRTDALVARMHAGVRLALDRRRRALADRTRRLEACQPHRAIAVRRARLAALEGRLTAALGRAMEQRKRRAATLIGQLSAYSPLAVLERGYAIASAGGHVLRRPDQVAVGDPIAVRLERGELDCRVVAVRPTDPERR